MQRAGLNVTPPPLVLSPQPRAAADAESISEPSLRPGQKVTEGQAESRGQYKCVDWSNKDHQENRTGETTFQGSLRPNGCSVSEWCCEAVSLCQKAADVLVGGNCSVDSSGECSAGRLLQLSRLWRNYVMLC